jgi:hypothetical protein
MASRSRTYLPTDWKVWVYTPVAGKFRLDFSLLNGTDVLGGPSDEGSIQVLDLDITNIELQDGQAPDTSVFGQFTAGTMNLTAQLLTYDSTFVAELYNGKEIYLTLENEGNSADDIFGTNTVFFMGRIDSLDIQVDPINLVTTLNVSATDIISAVVNYPLTLTKSNSTTKSVQLTAAFTQLLDDKKISGYTSYDFGGSLASVYELNATETKSIGDWVSDYISSELAIYSPAYEQIKINAFRNNHQRNADFYTVAALVKNGELIPNAVITNLGFGQDGANVPTSFNLTNSTATYTSGTDSESSKSNPNIYSAQIDVSTAGLANIANQIVKYGQAIQPLEVTVITARTKQLITFDDSRPYPTNNDYFYPRYFYINGQEVSITPAFTGETTYHKIVGSSHTITPDYWQSTYQLLKGL